MILDFVSTILETHLTICKQSSINK